MSEPCDLSAVEARRLIGAKKLSPVELLRSCLARIEALNPSLNAVVAMDEAGALAAASAAEQAVIAGDGLAPLHGLPLGVKDLNETAGLRTTFGCLVHKDNVPARDEPLVARLRANGAIVLAKTNTPEFGAGANTRNAVYGATGNPFDPSLTCGGSSGGSAVALAVGMVPICTGSDHGGSLRIPAGFCGVVGFRPSAGLVPDGTSAAPFNPLVVEGPMARSMDDLLLLLGAMTGYERDDNFSRRDGGIGWGVGPGGWVPEIDLSRLRVAWSPDLGCAPVDAEIQETMARKVAAFAASFRLCERRDPPLADATAIFDVLRATQFAAGLGPLVEQHRAVLGPNVIANVEHARTLSLMDVGRAQAAQQKLLKRMRGFFDEVDLLLAPAASVSPFPHAQWYPPTVGGQPSKTYIDWLMLTGAVTVTATPVVALPCGRDRKGLPFGIQIVGPQGADGLVLGAARAIERVFASDPALRRPVPAVAPEAR
ncbi:MAG: amidase [Alphaproteobacteria bacterium]|nr:amidase [Alphaproteobacteria bacterium]